MLRKVKTISEIYSEIKNYDLVITSDAPLATALNKLVQSPRLDFLAMTPKQIASKFAELYFDKIYEKFEVVLEITKKTGSPVKIVHQTLEKIYEVWMYNAKLEFAGQFLSEDELAICKYLPEYDTIETAMENFNEDFYGDKKIAVAGEELFSLIDLEVLPRKGIPADRIELFKNERFEIDETHIFPTSGKLIDSILELINMNNADETAIVINPDSKELEILKSRIKESGVNIEVKNYLYNESSVKSFISFIELSLRANELKVREYISLAAEIGIEINNYYSNYDLVNFIEHINRDKYLAKLFEVSKNITSYKFSELISKLKTSFEFTVTSKLTEIIELVELGGKNITEKNLIDLKYFLKEFDIELSSEKSGVLFVNALNSAFIDRQLIFYVGVDNNWMKLFPDKDYLNKEEEEKKNLERFQILIQQGMKKFYFVLDSADNVEIPPCYYFLMLGESDAISFKNKYFNPVYVNPVRESGRFKERTTQLPSEKKIITAISPTSFTNYFKCPKYYSIKKIIPNEETPALKKGTLLHEFAELYFHHPEYAKENFQNIHDSMVHQMSLFLKNTNKEFLQTEFQIGMESIITFIDNRSLHKTLLDEPIPAEGNRLMKKLALNKIYENTEQRLTETELTNISGKIDVQSGNTIVDYKSSKIKRSEINRAMKSNQDYINVNESDEFDFQAIAYITSLRRSFNEICFIYYFLFTNFKNQISDKEYPVSNEIELKYLPMTFLEYIRSAEVFEKLKVKDEVGKLLGKIGFENYNRVIDKLKLDDAEYFNESLICDRVIETTNYILDELGLRPKSIGANSQQSLNKNYISPMAKSIFRIRTGNWNPCIIFKDDSDKFSKLIKEKLLELNQFENSKYEYSPVFASREICKECDCLNICVGNKLWH